LEIVMPRVITVSHIVVSEFNSSAVFTVRLSEADPVTPVTVSWNLSELTAAKGYDFTNVSGLLTFNPGIVEQTISVPIIDNLAAELPGTFQVNLFNPSANAQIGNTVAVATIIDNDASTVGTPVVTINDFVVDEAGKEATFVVTLDRPSSGVVSMNYTTQDGGALAGSDYVATSGSLSFAPGETAKTVKVTLLNDTAPESSEAFNLVLSALSGATTLDPVGTAIIAENDAAQVSTSNISVDDIVVGESQAYADFLVRLDQPNTAAVKVFYDTYQGTAASFYDYRTQGGYLTFAPGEMVKTVRVTVSNDTDAEAAENFTLFLSSASANATIARNTATATIIDNDTSTAGTPVVTINDFVVDEAGKEATFVVTLDRPSSGVVSMNYTTQDGGALAGSDYVATSGSLSFAPGETAKTVKVSLLNDTAPESSEAFNLVLSALSGATTLDPVGTAIIAENDAAQVSTSNISVDDIVVGESQTYADFLVRLDQPNTAAVKVFYDTYQGTAASSYDYLTQGGYLTFAPGEMVKTVRVTVSNDTGAEAAENFTLFLSSASANATIARNTATATIIDNDTSTAGTPVVTINDFVVDEAGKEATFVVTLDRPSSGVVSMNYTTQDGGALAGSDYVATSGSLSFAPGETAKTVKVTLLNDTAPESSEAFNLVLSALSGATTLDPVGTAIITENDAAQVSTSNISVDDIVVGESQAYADFLVRLDQPNTAAVKVFYDTYQGTAASFYDYITQGGYLTFAPGEMVKTVRVTVSNDTDAEAAENFTLSLSSASANATIARNTATATIIDNDATSGTPVLRVGDAVVDEASGLVQVALTLDRPSLGAVTITYAVQAATAVSGSDFTVFPAGTIGFAPGETAKLVTVGILKDLTAEPTEVFDIAVTSATGATVGDGRGHVFINGNGSTPVVSPVLDLRNVLTVEGPGYVDFLVTLSAPSSNVVKVNYQTVAGTASLSDFKGQSGTLTFSAGETLKVIRLTTEDDATVEAQEAFTLELLSPINATLGNAIATATILDNDSPPPVASVVLNGSAAGDILRGSPFADAITGGDGNDVLDGSGGDDNLAGGAGDDIYLIEDAGDSYTEAVAGGTDLVISYLSTLTLGDNVENLNLVAIGTADGTGNGLDNLIYAGDGDNVIDGTGGTDTVSYAFAGAGVTVSLATVGAQATGGSGSDTLISIENLTGSGFNDALTGNDGNNVLDGGAGNDTLNGGAGADTMLGGDGSDLYTVDNAGDVVTETNAAAAGGIDTVNALVDHTLGANVENLNLIAAGAVNGTGNALDNLIYAGAGNNVIDGAGGTDTVSYAFAGAGVTVSLATAGAQATGGSGSDTLISIENLTGSGFNDNLTGNAGSNVLDGGAGNDTLNGGSGADTMLGGYGSDLYTVDNAGDVVTESNAAAAGGIDTVNALVDHTLGANVENLNLIAAGAVNGTGNTLDNLIYAGAGNNVLDGAGGTDTVSYAFAGAGVTVSLATAGAQATGGSGSDTLISIENLTGSGFNDNLTGNAGNNVLDGGAGNDTLNGGTGADTMLGGDGSDLYIVDHAGDVVTETNAAAAGGIDTVNALVDHTLGANVENLNLIAAGAVNGTGNALDNLIYAGAGNNIIDGAGGTDTVSYAFAGAGVTVSLATAGAQATGGSGSDTLISIENLTGSGFNDNLTGNAGNNVLDGGAGSDFLNGATGADTLLGGDGTDSYVVDNAGDLVSESNSSLATGGNDVVYSYVSAYTLTANVERLRLMLSGASNGTGNALDNILYAGDGNNVLDGTAGNDTVSYAFAGAGVTVSLATAGAQATGGSGSDTLISIENLIGSGFNDNPHRQRRQ
jgi:Ca2+-binding RTX toxin-like protein